MGRVGGCVRMFVSEENGREEAVKERECESVVEGE